MTTGAGGGGACTVHGVVVAVPTPGAEFDAETVTLWEPSERFDRA